MLVRRIPDIRPKSAARPFALPEVVATDDVKRDAGSTLCADDGGRFLRAHYGTCLLIEHSFLHLEPRILDLRKVIEEFGPVFEKSPASDLPDRRSARAGRCVDYCERVCPVFPQMRPDPFDLAFRFARSRRERLSGEHGRE